MDLFDRRILARLSRQLPLEGDEHLLDFEVGTTRPYGWLPPPFPNQFPENARVEMAASDRALYFQVHSKSHRAEVARVPWARMATFGPFQAEGRWKRWSLKGRMSDGLPVQVSLNGRPRPSMVAVLAELIPAEDQP